MEMCEFTNLQREFGAETLFVILIAMRSVVWENCHRTVFLQDMILSWFALGAG